MCEMDSDKISAVMSLVSKDCFSEIFFQEENLTNLRYF